MLPAPSSCSFYQIGKHTDLISTWCLRGALSWGTSLPCGQCSIQTGFLLTMILTVNPCLLSNLLLGMPQLRVVGRTNHRQQPCCSCSRLTSAAIGAVLFKAMQCSAHHVHSQSLWMPVSRQPCSVLRWWNATHEAAMVNLMPGLKLAATSGASAGGLSSTTASPPSWLSSASISMGTPSIAGVTSLQPAQ